MGKLLFLSGDLAGAEQHVRRGISYVTEDGDAYYIAAGYFILAQILAARGDTASSLEVMEALMLMAGQGAWPPSAKTIAARYEAHIQILCGQADKAALWAGNTGSEQLDVAQFPDIEGQPYYGIYCTVHETFEHAIALINMTLARYHLATHQPQTAVTILDQLLAQTDSSDQAALRSELFLLKALALYRLGQSESVAACLLEAVDLVADEPYWQLFINPHEPMERLLTEAAHADRIVKGGPRQSVRAAFIGQVLHRIKAQGAPAASPHPPCPDYSLTTREVDVLSQLAAGLAYREIASRMAISTNTVKSHLKRAYDKLDVTNSVQAINKAKSLGLVK
jgi:ATP/maltotriose-dependent transcriptional regulator MalT